MPRQIEENGLKPDQIEFEDEALKVIAETRARRACATERQIGTVCRKIARDAAEGKLDGKAVISADRARELLGPRSSSPRAGAGTPRIRRRHRPRVDAVGGEVLFVEATAMDGSGNLTITGQLGDVMKESAQAALSWVRGHQKELAPDLPDDWFAKHDIHIHVPSGAVPKDGPLRRGRDSDRASRRSATGPCPTTSR